ncbi:MAG: ADP-ribosylation factor-like protein [Candidatus Jordarchaeum sp.]|uniref:ADP-ribosylation factor-like protein n=1 Tax=Candidatus Jordarchaeum sp. TaxID=2823881 RepID=UPI00404A5973
MMEQIVEGMESEARRIKVLVMGPHAAGKTAILKQTIYGLQADKLRKLLPTILIDVPPETKKGKYLCRFFECGGQERFFEEYHRPENEKNIFNKVNIFIFVVDSANEDALPLAHKEFWRALTKLSKYSPNALTIIFAHKQDLPDTFSPGEVMDLLLSPPGSVYPTKLDFANLVEEAKKISKRTLCYGTSIEELGNKKNKANNPWIKSDEAIQITLQIYSKFIQEYSESSEKIKAEKDSSSHVLQEILGKLNKEVGAYGSMLIDKSSGLSAASTVDHEEITQSMMGIIILNSTKVLRELEEKVLNIVILRGEEHNVMLVNVTEDFSLLVILPLETDVQLGYAIYMVSETAKKIKEILQSTQTTTSKKDKK